MGGGGGARRVGVFKKTTKSEDSSRRTGGGGEGGVELFGFNSPHVFKKSCQTGINVSFILETVRVSDS